MFVPQRTTASLLIAVALVSSATGQLTDERVRESLDRGVRYLKSKQRADGNWPGYADFPAGVAGLCTLALLNAGLDLDDPAVAKGLAFLRGQPDLGRTYAVALQTMVLCAAEPDKDLFQQIGPNAAWLFDAQRKQGPSNGAWGYRKDGNQADNSNSQFALLALYEAERAGIKVPETTWRRALDYWKGQQKADGSFGYGMSRWYFRCVHGQHDLRRHRLPDYRLGSGVGAGRQSYG